MMGMGLLKNDARFPATARLPCVIRQAARSYEPVGAVSRDMQKAFFKGAPAAARHARQPAAARK